MVNKTAIAVVATTITLVAIATALALQKHQEQFLTRFKENRKGCYLFVPQDPLQSGSIDTQAMEQSSTALHPTSFQIKLLFTRASALSSAPLLRIGKHFRIEATSNEIILKLRNKVQHIPLTIPPNQVNTLTMRFMGIPFNSITLHFNGLLMYSKTFGYGFIEYPNRVYYFQDLDNVQIKGIEFCKFFNDETKLMD